MILAFFAIFAGFIGLPGDNPLHRFLSRTVLEAPEVLDFDLRPMLIGIVVSLTGLFIGFMLYGMRPVREGEVDPTERMLGAGIWTTLQNRFYMDIFYRRYLVQPAEWFATNIVIQAIDKDTIDGVLDTIAEGFTWVGEFFKRFNLVVIDGVGDGIPRLLGQFARWFRPIQSGRVQQYLLVVTLALLVIGALLMMQAR